MSDRSFSSFTGVFLVTAFIGLGLGHATAQTTTKPSGYVIGTPPPGCVEGQMRCITQKMRVDAAKRAKAAGKMRMTVGMDPGGLPDYFGVANWALSPLPGTTLDINGVATSVTTKGIRKFVDKLPGIGKDNQNNLGAWIPLAIPITTGRPGVPADGDYYEIGLKDYTGRMHSDLPATTQLRGYYDKNPAAASNTASAGDNNPHYLGPIIIARRDRPVRVKFTNELDPAVPLFMPIDTSLMGADTRYSQNRATLHLHGGTNPWISDGTPHQWITAAGDPTSIKSGASKQNVPDMMWLGGASVAPGTVGATSDPGPGSSTFYWANQ
jgi:hypothetical protein